MSNALQILVDQAAERADKTAQALAKTRQKLAQSQEKMNMLETYRNECQNNIHTQSVAGITGMQLQNQLAYVNKIGLATQQQSAEVAFLSATVQKQLIEWQSCLAEQKKYQALIEREKLKQAQKEAKRDQKMNDEFAARIFRTQAAGE